MDWKRYREFFVKNKIDEDFFVLGVDLGDATSAISYFDVIRNAPEVLDISGGYGKPCPPTVLQYITASREWIFGEYAILNANGSDALLTNFISRLGDGAYLDIGEGGKSVADVTSIYLEQLIGNCKSINPKATVAGICTVVPDFVTKDAKDALADAFGRAGYKSSLIGLIEEREALLHYCAVNGIGQKGNKLLWLDFGARGLRGGLYEIDENFEQITCLASDLSGTLSCNQIDEAIFNLLAIYYCKEQGVELEKVSKVEKEQILAFAHGYRDMLLNQDGGRDTKLYYNFVHPPFAKTVTQAQIGDMTRPWKIRLAEFVNNLLGGRATAGIMVICTGGGFEMPWAKGQIAEMFNNAHFHKNPKGILAQGATLYAVKELGLIKLPEIVIEDSHKLPFDVGIDIVQEGRSQFHILMERGSWLWQKPKTTHLIARGEDAEVELLLRDEVGKISKLGTAKLNGLPKRPAGTTRIALDLEAKTADSFAVRLKDLGFGEIFPATGYIENYVFDTLTK
ncbi:MAG: DUF5716 family protein [Defluviitaleaceae bacterium]|nr:DUF5716 family protein [Defluviitaleaceae bacterium]